MNLVSRVKGILMNPRQEWAVIDGEPLDVGELLVKYVLPLAAIGPIATIIGWSTFGIGGLFRPSIGSLIGNAILMYILTVCGLFLLAWVTNALAPKFGATQSMPQAIKLAAYASTAAWVAAVFQIIPMLSILAAIGGLYTLYLFWVGLPILMKAPPEQRTTYAIAIIVAVIVLYFVVAAISRAVMF